MILEDPIAYVHKVIAIIIVGFLTLKNWYTNFFRQEH